MSNDTLSENTDFIDAVAEMLNIGMGAAASALSQMVDKEVLLSVPSVAFVTRETAMNTVAAVDKVQSVSGVSQTFDGAFNGDAILLFPERQSLALVRAMLGEDNDVSLDNLSEMEQEAITEIGNVILNACLSSIADMLHKPIDGSIPAFVQGTLQDILFSGKSTSPQLPEDIVLMLKMDFSIEQMAIEGYVSFLMDVDSIADFKASVENVFL